MQVKPIGVSRTFDRHILQNMWPTVETLILESLDSTYSFYEGDLHTNCQYIIKAIKPLLDQLKFDFNDDQNIKNLRRIIKSSLENYIEKGLERDPLLNKIIDWAYHHGFKISHYSPTQIHLKNPNCIYYYKLDKKEIHISEKSDYISCKIINYHTDNILSLFES